MMTKQEWMDTHTLVKDKDRFGDFIFEECLDEYCFGIDNVCPFGVDAKSVVQCRENVFKYIELKERIDKWKSL